MHIGRKKFFGKVVWGMFGENKIEMRTVIYVGLLSIADAKQNIIEAKNDNDRKACEGLLRVANKLQFQFSKEGAISYGHCTKFDKSVSFIPAVCQLYTQECFEHRRQ